MIVDRVESAADRANLQMTAAESLFQRELDPAAWRCSQAARSDLLAPRFVVLLSAMGWASCGHSLQ
jgi:hypothetical protein